MSNLGLERFLWSQGIALHRAAVGDRYVVEAMRAGGYNIGGEQSGHIVLADHATTGDGLLAALQILAELVTQDKPAHELLRQFDPLPQLLKNVRFAKGQPLEDETVKATIAAAEKQLGGTGRILIRKSGTEPLIRVMAEGEDEALINDVVDRICEAVRKAA
jgi:phosphoglucosamine mutase